jgi:hypothetical protein
MADPKKPGEIVWIACRGAAACEGQQSMVLSVAKIPASAGGGTMARYRCTKCNRLFQIKY